MRAPVDTVVTAAESVNAPSEYVDLMPKLREFAALRAADPLRGVLREELILAFLPVVDIWPAATPITSSLRWRS